MRLRGKWTDYRVRDATGETTGVSIPALPMLHPAFLLRQPAWKAQTWRDLLSLQAKLEAKREA
jgi:DNA polymerase